VELDAGGRDEAAALHEAASRKIPYLVFVAPEQAKKGEVRVRRLRDRADQSVALTALAAYACSEGAKRSPGKAS
jgi:histidyl-tRNA synthetase